MRNHLMCSAVLLAASLAAGVGAADRHDAPVQGRGWTLGEDAKTRQNPLTPDEKTIAAGKAIFKSKCQRCHGPGGLGDGPDADPDATDMDLTNPKRTSLNSDGVVFYKVSNGRNRPKMPPFRDEMSEEQIWQVVTYVQTLRKKP